MKDNIHAHAGPGKTLREKVGRTFTALKHRNYRLWFWGQMVSMFGTWMQLTAQGFLVYQLTSSPAYLGLVGFASGIPTWLFTLYGGVISDRMSRKKLLIMTQSAMMVLAFVLAWLTFSGSIKPWHIVVLAFLTGIANAFDAPARQTFVADMVPKEDITNAVALNGTMYNTSTILGPAIAGLLYAMVGPAWCFTINGISYLAIIVGLLMMNVAPVIKKEQHASVIADLKEGVKYVLHHPTLLGIMGMMSMMGIFGLGFTVLLPAWSVDALKGDATTNGMLQAARGLGALAMALWVASLGHFSFKGKLITIGSFVFPVMIIVFGFIKSFPVSFAVLVVIGMANLLISNVSTALTQVSAEDRIKGRVMGVFTLVFFGTMPIGSLLIGAAATWAGEQAAIIGSGVMALICSILIWRLVPQLRAAE